MQNKQTTILVTQKIVGLIFENPSVVFKKPFEAIPVIIAKARYIYPDNKAVSYTHLTLPTKA